MLLEQASEITRVPHKHLLRALPGGVGRFLYVAQEGLYFLNGYILL